jgi:transposase
MAVTIVETRAITGGVDTHADTHVAAALDPVGGLLGVREFPVTAAGYAGLLGWLAGFGTVCLVGIEGTGSYGAGLARHMTGADAVQGQQVRGMAGDQGHDERIEAGDLAVEELGAAAELPQRDPGVVADDGAGPGPQGRQLGDQVSGGVRGEPGAQVVGAGHDQGPGLVDGLGPLGAGAALGDHQRPDGLDRAIASFGRAI